MVSLREQILGASDSRPEPVEVPEWGVRVWIRVMSGAQRDSFEAETYRFGEDGVELVRENTRARLLVRCLCDEAGAAIFTPEDLGALGAKSGVVLDRLFEKARRLNALTPADLEELEKNSGSGRGAASSSGLPSVSE